MAASDDAVRLLLMTAGGSEHTNVRWHADNCTRLAMQWPSLAAALADLLAAYEVPVPTPFRAAASIMRGVAPDPEVDALERAETPVGARFNGPWCMCPLGPDTDGRGHLSGEGRCHGLG